MEKWFGSARRWMTRVAGVAAVLALAACGGGGGSSSGGEGTVRVSLTDAPACYDNVFITVEAVRFHTSADAGEGNTSGWHELRLDAPVRVDLLDLTNGVLEELGSVPLPAGRYSQVRLVLAENTRQDPLANAVRPRGGELVPLKTPSGQQSGIKLQAHFEVEEDKLVDVVLDFDACKSVVKRGQREEYLLKPVVSVTPKFVGGIQGHLTTTMSLTATSVSAQRNGEVVRATVPKSTGEFTLAFLPAGTYTVVITSEGRATSIVTSVPVGTATLTTLNGTASRIVLPTSAMGTVTGTVTASTGSGTQTAPVVNGMVRATQDVGGTRVEVNATQTEPDAGGYALRLPLAAPRRAAFSSGRIGSFSGDADAAGVYQLRVTAAGLPQLTRNIDLGADATLTSSFRYD
ncbi:MAG: DUF4382 domain-containing protein [Ramlibacter sp.]